MSLSPSCTLLNHCSAIVDQLFDNVTSHPTGCHMAVSSVVRLGGEEGVRVMVNKMIAVLLREDLLHTSREDVEIMMTPPTHLWHQELRQQ